MYNYRFHPRDHPRDSSVEYLKYCRHFPERSVEQQAERVLHKNTVLAPLPAIMIKNSKDLAY